MRPAVGEPDLRGFEWYYWHQRCHAYEIALPEQHHHVTSIAFSADGKRMATAMTGFEGLVTGVQSKRPQPVIAVWNVLDGELIATFDGIRCVTFSPDGKWIAASRGNRVRVWDVNTGSAVNDFGDIERLGGVSFSANGKRMAAVGDGGPVVIWDVHSGVEVRRVPGQRSVSLNQDGDLVAAAQKDHSVTLTDIETGKTVHRMTGHKGNVNCVRFNSDASRLVTGGDDGTACVWDARSGAKLLVLRGHSGTVYDVAFDPASQRIATAGRDRRVVVWDENGRESFTVRGHDDWVMSLAFTSDGRFLATGDRQVKIWNAERGQEGVALSDTPETHCIAFSHDGERLATGHSDGCVRLQDPVSGKILMTLTGHSGRICSVTFHPGGQRLASACLDGTVRLWDLQTGTTTGTLSGHEMLQSVAFSDNGTQLATAGGVQCVLWDAATGDRQLTLKGPKCFIQSGAFTPDGRRFVAVSGRPYDPTQYGEVYIWDTDTGRAIA